MKEWYSASELAGLPGMPGTVQRVNSKAKNGCWQSRARKARGGGREYHISALPPETRAHLHGQVAVTLYLQPSRHVTVRLLARLLRPIIREVIYLEAKP